MINMKKYIILLLAVTSLFACKKSNGDDEQACEYVCIVHHYNFDFRLVDKNTGADLVFGANPRYSTADIKLFYDAAGAYPINIAANTSARAFGTFLGTQTMYLKVGTTTYKLDATYRGLDCCSSIVETLKIDGVNVCTHCSAIIEIPVN